MSFSLNASMYDFLVLSIVEKNDTYGYQISQIIKKAATNTKDSALYPVLRRLQESHYLTTYDQQFQGRNRKYYSITEEGRRQYELLLNEWTDFKEIIDRIVKGEEKSE